MAAAAALLPGDQGRTLTRYPAPASAVTTRKTVSPMTSPVVRDVRLAGARLRCCDNAVLSDGHPRGDANTPRADALHLLTTRQATPGPVWRAWPVPGNPPGAAEYRWRLTLPEVPEGSATDSIEKAVSVTGANR